VDDTTNWKPDPFGVHELRFFSADGKPTLLVMDGGKRSYDKPPTDQTESPPEGDQLESDPMRHQQLSPAETQPAGPAAAASASSASEDGGQGRHGEDTKEPSQTESGPMQDQQVTPAQTQPLDPRVAEPTTQSVPFEKSEVQRSTFFSALPGVATDTPSSSVADSAPPQHESLGVFADDAREHESETMSHALKVAYGVVCSVLAVSVLGVLFVHLHHSNGAHSVRAESPTTTSMTPSTTTTSSEPANAPSTVSRLSPTAEVAADDLVTSWSMNNRLGALAVATPTAATTLFSTTYTSGQAINRGCSTTFSPIVCTFGPPGGASPTDPIYQIRVSEAPGGWYVSSVRIEN
jgi:hypothetical protein